MTIPTQTRPVSSLPTGTGMTRLLIAKAFGDVGREMAKDWRDVPHVYELLTEEATWHSKAALDPMTTSDAGAGGPLAAYGVTGEVLQLLRGVSAFDQFADRARRVPPHVQVPREVTGITGGWIAEAGPTPIANDAFATVQQDVHKLGVAVAVSKELLVVSRENEAIVRQAVIGGIAAATSTQFLDPTITAIAGTRPASVTNGGTQITSTGGTAAQIIADLTAMIQAITTPMRNAVWILPAKTAFTIAARLGGAGLATGLPRELFGIPTIVSASAPERQITLADADGVIYSDLGMTLDVATHGSIEMRTDTTSPATASVILVSLWSSNLVAVKCLRWVSWKRAVPGSVSYLLTTY